MKKTIVLDIKNCEGISRQEFDERKKDNNHMKWCKLQPGNRSEYDVLDMSNNNDLIPEIYRAASDKSGECMWASAALLVHQMDVTAGNKMMQLCKVDPNKYEWLTMHSSMGRRKKKCSPTTATTLTALPT